jgi:hypothetical protein
LAAERPSSKLQTPGSREAANPKIQAPKKSQPPNSKKLPVPLALRFEIWNLGFYWDLGFGVWSFPGVWSLEFGAFESFPFPLRWRLLSGSPKGESG